MHHLRRPLFLLLFLVAEGAAPCIAQTVPSEAGPMGRLQYADTTGASLLGTFVRDATTVAALPWQRDLLGLSPEQVQALRGIAGGRGRAAQELYYEIQVLFEAVGQLDTPVDAHEAFALYYDLAAHKAEALLTFHATVEAMLEVLTEEQRARWEAELEAAAMEQQGS